MLAKVHDFRCGVLLLARRVVDATDRIYGEFLAEAVALELVGL